MDILSNGDVYHFSNIHEISMKDETRQTRLCPSLSATRIWGHMTQTHLAPNEN